LRAAMARVSSMEQMTRKIVGRNLASAAGTRLVSDPAEKQRGAGYARLQIGSGGNSSSGKHERCGGRQKRNDSTRKNDPVEGINGEMKWGTKNPTHVDQHTHHENRNLAKKGNQGRDSAVRKD
jgi:hypothetical protein